MMYYMTKKQIKKRIADLEWQLDNSRHRGGYFDAPGYKEEIEHFEKKIKKLKGRLKDV